MRLIVLLVDPIYVSFIVRFLGERQSPAVAKSTMAGISSSSWSGRSTGACTGTYPSLASVFPDEWGSPSFSGDMVAQWIVSPLFTGIVSDFIAGLSDESDRW